MIERNKFEEVKCIIDKVYSVTGGDSSPQVPAEKFSDLSPRISELVPLLRRYITKVREEQDKVLELANGKMTMVTIAPAFVWAQDLNSVALSIKFAHRFDSPSCIDIYDQNVTITNNTITVS